MIDFSPLDRHEKIGLFWSGGKDSTACLWLLREHWHRLTVYHYDTGDAMPETRKIIAETKGLLPNFVHLQGDVRGWIKEFGLPTDLLPYSTHGIGVMTGENGTKLVTRYHCCYMNLMWPMWERAKQDGITLCIRGTRRSDVPKLPMDSGQSEDGIELWLPINEWSDDEVHEYLRSTGAPLSPLYPHFKSIPDCARCPAWWTGLRGPYLKAHHPELFADYARDIRTIAKEIAKPINALRAELRETT